MATPDTLKLKTINISPSSSAEGLREKLEKAASTRGMKVTPLVSAIYEYAVRNKVEFEAPLENAGRKIGEHIGAKVSPETASDLEKWAKQTNRSRGYLCCYILEKVFEDGLLNKILG